MLLVDVIDVVYDMFCSFLVKIRIHSTSLVTFSKTVHAWFGSKLFSCSHVLWCVVGCRLSLSCSDITGYDKVDASNDDINRKIKTDIS